MQHPLHWIRISLPKGLDWRTASLLWKVSGIRPPTVSGPRPYNMHLGLAITPEATSSNSSQINKMYIIYLYLIKMELQFNLKPKAYTGSHLQQLHSWTITGSNMGKYFANNLCNSSVRNPIIWIQYWNLCKIRIIFNISVFFT